MYYSCEKYYKPITAQYYIANYVSWVLRLTCWIYKQVRLTNVLSEQNSFVCRGLSVLESSLNAGKFPQIKYFGSYRKKKRS